MHRPWLVAVVALAAACGSHAGSVDSGRPADAAAAAVPDPLAPAVAGDPMGVIVRKLPNGLTLMVTENHEEPRIECWITTRAGSAKDPAEATGLAHYLEHMNFKGTSRMGTLDWEKEKPHLDRITALYDELFVTTDPGKRAEIYKQIDAENQAANQYEAPNEFDSLYNAYGFKGLNAFTSDDQTTYMVDIPANRLETWAKVEAARFTDPVYRLFTTELEAVYEEKNRGMDNKARQSHEARRLAVYPQHPYGTQPTLGTVEHLKNPSLTKIYDWFRTWYVPGNMVVAVSGDFHAADAIAILEKHFGAFQAKPVAQAPSHPLEKPRGVKRVELKFEAEEQIDISWLTVAPTHPDADALKLADMMLANGKTGLIDVNINQAQLLQQAGASPEFLVDAGCENVVGIAKKGQTLEDAEKLLLAQVELLRQGSFSEDDMKAALTQFEIQQKQGLESNQARVSEMTEAFVHGRTWDWKVGEIDRMRRLSKADVVAAANTYFGGDYVVVCRRNGKPELPEIKKPGFTPVKIKADQHSQYYTAMLAEPAEPVEPRFVEAGRDYVSKDLRSGRLIHGKNPANDLFQLSFSIPIGTDTEPRLSMALSLLDFGGAGELDALAFKRRMYALGTSFTAGAGRQETTVTISGLDANLAQSIRLVREHFEKPTGATQADLAKLVERIIGSRSKQKNEAKAINAALGSWAQRGEQSDYLRQMRNDELSALDAASLLALARSVWDYPRTALYVGSLSPEDAAAAADLAPFGAGFDAMKPAPRREPVRYVSPAKSRVLLVDKKAAQAAVGVYFADGTFDRTMVPVHRVYNEYMSGSMGGVVFQEVREARALAYDAGTFYVDAAWKDDGNLFLGVLGTQADKTLDAIEVLMRIVRDLPAAESRMDNTKRTIDETYRSSRIGFRRIPGSVLTWSRQGLDGDPRPWNWEQAKKLTLADLTGWASKWKTAPCTITIVGDKSKFDLAKLAEFGEVIEMKPDQIFAW